MFLNKIIIILFIKFIKHLNLWNQIFVGLSIIYRFIAYDLRFLFVWLVLECQIIYNNSLLFWSC